MIYIGIDGGLNGGITAIDSDGFIESIVMPVIKGQKGNIYDIQQITEFFKKYKYLLECEKITVILEKAHSMPKQGVVSTFKIGECFGIMKGIIVALGLPYEVIAARTWQKAIFQGQTVKDTKQSSILFCKNKYPDIDWRASDRCRIDHDGKTDATCIAVYGLRHL